MIAASVVAIFIAGLGVARWHWYLEEMGATFVGLAVVVTLVAGLGSDRGAVAFCKGPAELTTTALLIGFARAVKVVLEDASVIDTIVHGVVAPLTQLGPELAAIGMFAIQSACNFLIPSGSGQAYVTMPVMVPIADLVGVARQTAVLAFLFGDGFTNMVVPTNAVLVGLLGLGGVSFGQWLRFVWPVMVQFWILGSVALALAVMAGYGAPP